MAGQNQNSLIFDESSDRESFKCTEQESYICDNMPFNKKRKTFDVVLIAEMDNIQVHAHKMVLSTSSEYFQVMFRSTMKEAKADEIKLKEIDGKTLSAIIEFMYTASIELCNETVESVLKAADRFQVYNLGALCSDFMGKQLDESNCLGIGFFAEQHNATTLCKKATAFALKHFETVCKEREFFDLNKEQLIAYISSDGLRVSSEENVFLSLVAWVNYNKDSREPLIFDIFKHVRFTSLKPRFIIKNRHSVCKTVECYQLVYSWLEWHLSPESRTGYPRASVKPRKINKKLIFALGKDTDHMKVLIFDRDSNTWSIPDLHCPSKNRIKYRSIAIDKKLIVAGGRIDGIETNTVESYDFQTKKWTDLPSMEIARSLPGMAELDGHLYAVGSWNGKESSSVERYDFDIGKWQEVAPLLTPLTSKHVQVAALDGLLYVVGMDTLTMECYDPNINLWTRKAFKNEKSKSFGFAGVGEYLYAVGGEYNEGMSRTVERYHPSTDTWTEISSLRLGQKHMLCTALNNRLIACRGYDGSDFTDIVEEYNPETNEWTTLAPLVSRDLNSYSSCLFTI